MDPVLKYGLIVTAVIVGLFLFTKLAGGRTKQVETIQLSALNLIVTDVKRLFELAKQDKNVLVAVMHTTSALSKLMCLQQLDKSRNLSKHLDVDFEQLRLSIHALQQSKMNELNYTCPNLALNYELDWSV